uniref:Uncharacterized protein n=1 Tax=Candidatus Kentrum sp. LFY TaxID=2126342 RepID=A0A450UK96_9GAMM|nr:MAG: hypothetical protein BECKLFY1418A_GA0070994_102718 [Candidatus Kentron sp. LFY]
MAGSCHENTCHATTSTTAQASLPIIPRSSLKINAQTTRGLEIQIEIQPVDCVILSDSIVVSCRPRPLAFRSLVMVFALGKAMFPNLPGVAWTTPATSISWRYRSRCADSGLRWADEKPRRQNGTGYPRCSDSVSSLLWKSLDKTIKKISAGSQAQA